MFLWTDVVCVKSLLEPNLIEGFEEKNLILVNLLWHCQQSPLSRTYDAWRLLVRDCEYFVVNPV